MRVIGIGNSRDSDRYTIRGKTHWKLMTGLRATDHGEGVAGEEPVELWAAPWGCAGPEPRSAPTRGPFQH